MYVDLDRRFRDLKNEEPEDADLALHDTWSGVGWAELLEYCRVVLLAEAGSGKTTEMREQARRLSEEDKFAFFLPLERLGRGSVAECLLPDEEERYAEWKSSDSGTAWFFLDAVDELKLTERKLDEAFLNLSRDIADHLARARIVVSCRFSDWRPQVDEDAFRTLLPVSAKESGVPPQSSEEIFMGVVNGEVSDCLGLNVPDHGAHFGSESQNAPSPPEAPLRTVVMLSLSDAKVELFAQEHDVEDPAAFLEEIARQGAWTFARRPMDLTTLIAAWKHDGRLGTLKEQHEANVEAKLKEEDPDRPDAGDLEDADAHRGAEMLAFGLALTRTRTIRSPEPGGDPGDGTLDPAGMLPSWSPKKRRTLLRRGLFDPATYGRVRFHHRSVEEFLSARLLRSLRERGMSRRALFRLLFAEKGGDELVLPSTRPIAAWLALDDAEVRNELIGRAPEVLLSHGDPGSLELEDRRKIVKAFVEKYNCGGWRGLNMNEVRRFAHPQLAEAIRGAWKSGPPSEDARELLTKLIWLGPVEECADLALSAARDESFAPRHRVTAVLALAACERCGDVRELVRKMLDQPDSWPDEIVSEVAAELFPEFIEAGSLIALMERTGDPGGAGREFAWNLRERFKKIDPLSDAACSLRDGMVELILRGRRSDKDPWRFRSEFEHFANSLAALCERQIAAGRSSHDLIRACAIASRFAKGARKDGAIRDRFRRSLRREAFWAELEFIDKTHPAANDWTRIWATQNGLTGRLTNEDRPWLLAALADKKQPARRPVALYALIGLGSGRSETMLREMRDASKDDPALRSALEAAANPPEPGEEVRKQDREVERLQREQALEAEEEREDRRRWRRHVVDNPEAAFSEEKRLDTLKRIVEWLENREPRQSRRNVWNKGALVEAFSPEFADRAEKAFCAYWRTVQPKFWSEQPPGAKYVPSSWILGLNGVSAEAAGSGWAEALSDEEARKAAIYSTVELNGLAPFILDLARSRPKAIEEAIGGEALDQLRFGHQQDHLPLLHGLTYSDDGLKRLLAPRLLNWLEKWPEDVADPANRRWRLRLEEVLRVLRVLLDGEADRRRISELCAERYRDDPESMLALVWLRGLFESDAPQGTQALTDWLSKATDADRKATEAFAALFRSPDGLRLDGGSTEVFEQLVRCAYRHIRPAEDLVHTGVYSPSARDNAQHVRDGMLDADAVLQIAAAERDNAQHVRDGMLGRLLNVRGPKARQAVRGLAQESDFVDIRERLLSSNLEASAFDAEFSPFDPKDVVKLVEGLETPPNDRNGLFSVMLDRLDDIAEELQHGDFSDRREFRGIDETGMQRTIARLLKFMSKGMYQVTREEAVADGKRTDIRLLSGDQKAVIELKIADKWSASELKEALHDQLLGKYMRHCSAGCLLITYHGDGSRHWERPEDKHMNFPSLIDFLEQEAKAIEERSDVRITAFGLDLSGSLTASARAAG